MIEKAEHCFHCYIVLLGLFNFIFPYLLLNSLGLIATFFLSCLIILLIKWMKYIFLFRGSSPSKSHWKNRWKEWVVLLCSTDFICYSKIFKGFNGGNTSAKILLETTENNFYFKILKLVTEKNQKFHFKTDILFPSEISRPHTPRQKPQLTSFQQQCEYLLTSRERTHLKRSLRAYAHNR